MELFDIYDSAGKDGAENKAAYEKLPQILQYFISSQQKHLVDKVRRAVEKRFGAEGVEYLIKTSGFRAQSVNARYNGVADSLHLWGCAADFRKSGLFKSSTIPVCCDLECIDSGDCWHVQFKRG